MSLLMGHSSIGQTRLAERLDIGRRLRCCTGPLALACQRRSQSLIHLKTTQEISPCSTPFRPPVFSPRLPLEPSSLKLLHQIPGLLLVLPSNAFLPRDHRC